MSGARGKLGRALAEKGALGTLRKAVRDHVFRQELSFIMVADTADALPELTFDPDLKLHFRRLHKGQSMPPLGGWLEHREDSFNAMLDDGLHGILALSDGVAVGCMWAATADFLDPNSGLFVRVPPAQAYAFGAMVDFNFRDKRVARELAHFGMREMRAIGVDRIFNYCDIANELSYRMQRKLGFAESGELMVESFVLGRNVSHRRRYRGSKVPPAWNRPRKRPA